ncbi:MAG: hypothetical protein ABFQ65_00450 [Nanoarchaeota archaeon]
MDKNWISDTECRRSKKGQEEIVGFAMIIIIVSVVLLVFLSISLRNNEKETIKSYEIESFIQAFLQHTSECRRSDNLDYLSVQKLIFSCDNQDKCLDGQDTCEILEETLNKIFEEYWKVGEDRPLKGRKIKIFSGGKELLFIQEGNITSNSKGAVQEFFRSGSEISINFVVYY